MEQKPTSIKVYLDSDYHCHVAPFDGCIEYETDFFFGRENQIEKYMIVPLGRTWVGDNGTVFQGEMICPW